MQGGNILPDEGVDARALSLVAAFLAEIQQVTDLTGVERLLEAAARELGFHHYAMIHHDDHRKGSASLININNYPPDYAAEYFGGLYHRDDPVVHACIAANACFTWSEIADLIDLDPRHHSFLERGARHGVADGITVPAFVLGERSGSCNFCSPRTPGLAQRHLATVQIVGSFAFQKARRIVGGRRLRQVRVGRLRRRWLDCIVLAGQGKSNTDIATILDLSPATVKTYIEAACARYEVHNRTQLVIAAVLDGEIGIHEIATRQHRHLAT
ncbi:MULTISPECIES: helix-turn-helix transcriptional regulator [Sphingopyxis]|uniref:LuxR family quorum-sensing system transcriptional regulator CciR n=1 Tax=Sphingopyxis panaciterrulae TaxID=462372 RepID=A0A7W9B9B8_9SPHN|nr:MULTISPECIES: LuxR family transcriptional regulator [Sphingopyxis]MBB5708456.1 LuxR family quorum-sensing system transcriptional regulator CciR [Sphingopyxis panaciterrulae]HEX2813639.1 LuxR family transcriptional regulator [Sphingopyxis sp.]